MERKDHKILSDKNVIRRPCKSIKLNYNVNNVRKISKITMMDSEEGDVRHLHKTVLILPRINLA
jgi:hypothetical protein